MCVLSVWDKEGKERVCGGESPRFHNINLSALGFQGPNFDSGVVLSQLLDSV